MVCGKLERDRIARGRTTDMGSTHTSNMDTRSAPIRALVGALLLAAVVVGCDGGSTPAPSATPSAAAEADAAQAADLYQQLRGFGRLEQAERAGRMVLENYPGTAAAAQVQETYQQVRAAHRQQREASRLQELWVYHAVREEEGEVRTATLHRHGDDTSTAVADDAQGVRMVLRRHHAWGQAVYLLINNGDFACAQQGCSVAISFDDGPSRPWQATVSHEGPLPALFIEDDAAFITALQQAQWVAIQAPTQPEPLELRFQTGGFRPQAWLGTPQSAAASPVATQPPPGR